MDKIKKGNLYFKTNRGAFRNEPYFMTSEGNESFGVLKIETEEGKFEVQIDSTGFLFNDGENGLFIPLDHIKRNMKTKINPSK